VRKCGHIEHLIEFRNC